MLTLAFTEVCVHTHTHTHSHSGTYEEAPHKSRPKCKACTESSSLHNVNSVSLKWILLLLIVYTSCCIKVAFPRFPTDLCFCSDGFLLPTTVLLMCFKKASAIKSLACPTGDFRPCQSTKDIWNEQSLDVSGYNNDIDAQGSR